MVFGGGFVGYRFVKGYVDAYTSDKPANLPILEHTEEELTAIKDRVKEFNRAIDSGEITENLVLTTNELNALISTQEELQDKILVAIQDGLLFGEVSIPMDGIPGGKGKYFNASATFDVSLNDGKLTVTLADATVKGEKVPEQIIKRIGRENLAKDIDKDPEVAEMLQRFETLTIEEDKIILTPRIANESATASSPAEAETTESASSQEGDVQAEIDDRAVHSDDDGNTDDRFELLEGNRSDPP